MLTSLFPLSSGQRKEGFGAGISINQTANNNGPRSSWLESGQPSHIVGLFLPQLEGFYIKIKMWTHIL